MLLEQRRAVIIRQSTLGFAIIYFGALPLTTIRPESLELRSSLRTTTTCQIHSTVLYPRRKVAHFRSLQGTGTNLVQACVRLLPVQYL